MGVMKSQLNRCELISVVLVKHTLFVCFFFSYLRTMTALLDPAQIEERERRRQKQLEQQVKRSRANILLTKQACFTCCLAPLKI